MKQVQGYSKNLIENNVNKNRFAVKVSTLLTFTELFILTSLAFLSVSLPFVSFPLEHFSLVFRELPSLIRTILSFIYGYSILMAGLNFVQSWRSDFSGENVEKYLYFTLAFYLISLITSFFHPGYLDTISTILVLGAIVLPVTGKPFFWKNMAALIVYVLALVLLNLPF